MLVKDYFSYLITCEFFENDRMMINYGYSINRFKLLEIKVVVVICTLKFIIGLNILHDTVSCNANFIKKCGNVAITFALEPQFNVEVFMYVNFFFFFLPSHLRSASIVCP